MALTYRVGSFDDPKDALGTAHFVEHLAFAGGNKVLVPEIAALGTRVNGMTAYDRTEFSVCGHANDVEHALKFVANIVQNRPVTAEEIAGERSVFQHELNDGDTPARRTLQLDSFWRRAVGDPNWRTSHTKRHVKTARLTTERINSFKSTYYHPTNARLAIVSPFAPDHLRSRVEEYLPRDVAYDPAMENKERAGGTPTRALTVCRDAYGYIWADVFYCVRSTDLTLRLTADIIGNLMGGGPHSELFRTLRSERGLVYHVYADDWAYLSCTAMHCFLSVHKRSVYEALGYIVGRLNEIAARGITAEQLEREKQRITRWHEVATDHASGLASYLAYEAFRADDSIFQRADFHSHAVANLTLEQVNQAAAQLLTAQNRVTFVGGRVGPIARMRINRRLNGN
jgi:predicted Zn-dependent peptidase